MEMIEATFPLFIPKKKVIEIIQGNMKKNSKYTCEVEFDREEEGENVFLISSEDGPSAFYLIGCTAIAMLQHYEKKMY